MENIKIVDLDQDSIKEAYDLQNRLTKPPKSLGYLEELSVKMAGIYRKCPPPAIEKAAVLVFAGDHGVIQEGVTPWPQEVTYQMVLNFLSKGAAINAIASTVGADVFVIDVGVNKDLSSIEGLIHKKVCYGTKNIAVEDAMSPEEAKNCLKAGFEIAKDVIAKGYEILILGDMGIANTTPSAAIISYITSKEPRAITGRGTGIDDKTLEHKILVVEKILQRTKPKMSPIEIIQTIGGCEIGALAGAILGAASSSKAVIVDGVISLAGALIAYLYDTKTVSYMISGHLSKEPGAKAAVNYLGLSPLINLEMALGEGTGAALSLPIVKSAVNCLREMATFDSAGVSEKTT